MTKVIRTYEFEPNIKAATFVVPASESTSRHNHAEEELFIVVSGSGVLERSDGQQHLTSGDILSLPAFSDHRIVASDDEDLVVCNLYWYDLGNRIDVSQSNRLQVFLPSYLTPNGKMHIGHLAGPILSADILKRFRKIQGQETCLLTGTIGYQTNVAVTAREIGKSYTDTALIYSKQVKDTFDLANIDYDTFVTLEDEQEFQRFGRDFAKTLVDKGFAKLKKQNAPFCASRSAYLFEAHVKSICPHCGVPDVIGECEACGIFISDENLIDPVCVETGEACEARPLSRYFIPLEPHRGVFEEVYARLSPSMREHLLPVMKAPLPDIPMSILADEGVQISDIFDSSDENQVLYSAVELAPRFLYSLQKLGKLDEDIDLSIFFGQDNIYLRAVIFPILVSILYPNIRPTVLSMNYFYQINGSKFSTSRKNVRYLDELISDKSHSSDAVRGYLAYTRPGRKPTEFEENEIPFFAQETTELLDSLRAALSAFPKKAGTEPGSWDPDSLKVRRNAELLSAFAISTYEGADIEFRPLFDRLAAFAQDLRAIMNTLDEKPENLRRTNVFVVRYLSSVVLSALAPVFPDETARIAGENDVPLGLMNFNQWIRHG